MAENTKIEWATHSFSPWLGCSRVHIGCLNCYAESMSGRLGVTWGPDGTRRRTSKSTWKQVERWNRDSGRESTFESEEELVSSREDGHEFMCRRPRVFPSLCDPFEDFSGPDGYGAMTCRKTGELLSINSNGHIWPAGWPSLSDGDDWGIRPYTMQDVRRDFFALIDRTPNLDWLLLTKRPENVRRMWPAGPNNVSGESDLRGMSARRDNCWLLYSASDQETLEAGLPHLLGCRDLVPVLGLSLEPLLGTVDLGMAHVKACPYGGVGDHVCDAVDWVIVGGESGPRARPMPLDVLVSISHQCLNAGVPLFVKQDSGQKPGRRGRIPDWLWAKKELPK